MARTTIIALAWLACLGLLLTKSFAAPTATAVPATLGQASRYTDEMNGFSIRPPKGGSLAQSRQTSCLAQWVCHRPKSDKLLWSLSIHRSDTKVAWPDIRAAAQALQAELGQAGAKVEAAKFLTICNLPAVNFSGTIAGAKQLGPAGGTTKLPDTCFRQVWIQLQPGQYFVVKWDSVSLPGTFLDATWAKTLASLELQDTRKVIRQKTANARRAYELLWKSLSDEKLGLALPAKPQWFLIRQGDKPVGWTSIEARRVRCKGTDGFEVRLWAMTRIPGQKVRLSREVMFVGAKLSMELWQSRVQVGSGAQAGLVVEQGLRQQDMVVVAIDENGRAEQRQKKLPESVKNILLPKAIGILLPKLIDLTQTPAAYTFAEYDSGKNDFRMRTFTVIGSAEVNIDGRIISAIKVTDKPSANAKPLTLWLSSRGEILLSQAPGGLQAEKTTREKVLAIFPKAEAVISQINRASKKQTK